MRSRQELQKVSDVMTNTEAKEIGVTRQGVYVSVLPNGQANGHGVRCLLCYQDAIYREGHNQGHCASSTEEGKSKCRCRVVSLDRIAGRHFTGGASDTTNVSFSVVI